MDAYYDSYYRVDYLLQNFGKELGKIVDKINEFREKNKSFCLGVLRNDPSPIFPHTTGFIGEKILCDVSDLSLTLPEVVIQMVCVKQEFPGTGVWIAYFLNGKYDLWKLNVPKYDPANLSTPEPMPEGGFSESTCKRS